MLVQREIGVTAMEVGSEYSAPAVDYLNQGFRSIALCKFQLHHCGFHARLSVFTTFQPKQLSGFLGKIFTGSPLFS